MKHKHKRALSASLIVCFLSTWSLVHAQSEVTVDAIDVGIDGTYKVGFHTQLQITVTALEPANDLSLHVTIADGDGIASTFVTNGVALQQGTGNVDALVKFGRVRSEVEVQFRDREGIPISSRRFTVDEVPSAEVANRNLIVSIGPDIDVQKAMSMRQTKNGLRPIHVQVEDGAHLPTHWLGYEGVEVIVLIGDGNPLLTSVTSPQWDALNRWVQMGGRLILNAGQNAEATIGDTGPLARFTPGEFDRVQMQRQTSGIENYAGKTKRSLDSYVADGELSFRLPVALLTEHRGVDVVVEGIGGERTPVVSRASHGFGHVIFVAMDLASGPMSRWEDGRIRVLGKLLELALDSTSGDDADNQTARLTQIGFDDINGQLRAALDQFDGVRLVPFSWIAILIGLYVTLIGPLDYLLLRRFDRRFGLTWATFPIIVILGSVLAYNLTLYWKGQKLRVNQVDVVDIDVRSGLLRNTSWSHVFSPSSRKYDLDASVSSSLFNVQQPSGSIATWQGLPGSSFGGMNTSRVSHGAEGYALNTQLEDDGHQSISISGLPIDVYASRSLSGLVWGQVELPALAPLVADVENQLSGEIKNPLPVDLRDCMICYGRWVYPLPTLPAGGTTQLDRFSAKTIDGMLTRTQVDVDFKDRSQPWDRKSLDVSRIMEMMMFHEATGGTRYTALLHRYQGEIDFTDHLKQRTALLVGKIQQPACTLLDDNQAVRDSLTYVRLLLPVNIQTH